MHGWCCYGNTKLFSIHWHGINEKKMYILYKTYSENKQWSGLHNLYNLFRTQLLTLSSINFDPCFRYIVRLCGTGVSDSALYWYAAASLIQWQLEYIAVIIIIISLPGFKCEVNRMWMTLYKHWLLFYVCMQSMGNCSLFACLSIRKKTVSYSKPNIIIIIIIWYSLVISIVLPPPSDHTPL